MTQTTREMATRAYRLTWTEPLKLETLETMDLHQIANIIQKAGAKFFCGEPIHAGTVETYDHEGGVKVTGYEKLQWVYFVCPKCGYQMALWKLIHQLSSPRLFPKEA